MSTHLRWCESCLGNRCCLTNRRRGNALLKTLEEPPAETWFFLATASLNVYWQHYVVVVGYITLAAAGTVRRDLAFTRSDNVTGALLAALRLSAGSPGAALALFREITGRLVKHCVRRWHIAYIGRLVFAAGGP